MKDYDYLAKYVQELENLLYNLTPGGSKFAGDPQACAAWIRNRLDSVPGYVKRAKLAEAELAAIGAICMCKSGNDVREAVLKLALEYETVIEMLAAHNINTLSFIKEHEDETS